MRSIIFYIYVYLLNDILCYFVIFIQGIITFNHRNSFENRMSDIVVERMIVPWLQLDFLFHLFPQGAAQKRSLSILHDFSDRVS